MKRKKSDSEAPSFAIGVDGWPINSAVDPIDFRKRVYWNRMIQCERATRAGNLAAFVDAIQHCIELNMPPEPWMVHAAATLVTQLMLVRTGRGKFNSRQAVFNENQKHFMRWSMVRELLDRGPELYENWGEKCGLKEDNAFAKVAEDLKDTPGNSKKTIERSFRLVEKSGAEFYITRFKPNGK